MNKKSLIGNIMLLTTAFIWGTAFVAQRVGMDHIEPFTFGAARYILATLSLILVVWVMDNKKKKSDVSAGITDERTEDEKKRDRKNLLRSGAIIGTFLFVASSLQQIGLVYTTAGKASFITALYIVLVPILGIFLRQKPSWLTWIGVALSTVGLYLLCIKEGFSVSYGDFVVFLSAFFFAAHIQVCDYFTSKYDPIKLSCLQFAFAFLWSAIAAAIVENPTVSGIIACTIPIVYCGIFSAGVGYTFQLIAQKDTDPTVASLVLSLESVFGALGGYFMLHEILSTRELIGCFVMFAAIIVAQLPTKPKEIV